jgi:hypothetical protein
VHLAVLRSGCLQNSRTTRMSRRSRVSRIGLRCQCGFILGTGYAHMFDVYNLVTAELSTAPVFQIQLLFHGALGLVTSLRLSCSGATHHVCTGSNSWSSINYPSSFPRMPLGWTCCLVLALLPPSNIFVLLCSVRKFKQHRC